MDTGSLDRSVADTPRSIEDAMRAIEEDLIREPRPGIRRAERAQRAAVFINKPGMSSGFRIYRLGRVTRVASGEKK